MSDTIASQPQDQHSHNNTSPSRAQHLHYLRETISLAHNSPPLPTNFRVGCVLVSYPISSSPSQPVPRILSTGYTLELPGNTHAEQCALSKLTRYHSLPESDLSTVLTPQANVTLYTSLEPCGKRLSGNTPCVQRIIATRYHPTTSFPGGIRKVIFGAKEPGTFVTDSQSCRLLAEAGIEWEYIPNLEEEILRVAMEGHTKKAKDHSTATATSTGPENKPADESGKSTQGSDVKETWHPDVGARERQERESAPRNPKKRMMEVQI